MWDWEFFKGLSFIERISNSFLSLQSRKNLMKNIIITGTSRGIGFELALEFAKATALICGFLI